jgi:hypothetical protein
VSFFSPPKGTRFLHLANRRLYRPPQTNKRVTCIARTAIGAYASYSSLSVRLPWKVSRVVPTNVEVAPAASSATNDESEATSIVCEVTATAVRVSFGGAFGSTGGSF